MKIIKVQVRGGVLEVISIPKGIKVEVVELDNGEQYNIIRNSKTGKPNEVLLKQLEPLR